LRSIATNVTATKEEHVSGATENYNDHCRMVFLGKKTNALAIIYD
jgi:hypothetical protein